MEFYSGESGHTGRFSEGVCLRRVQVDRNKLFIKAVERTYEMPHIIRMTNSVRSFVVHGGSQSPSPAADKKRLGSRARLAELLDDAAERDSGISATEYAARSSVHKPSRSFSPVAEKRRAGNRKRTAELLARLDDAAERKSGVDVTHLSASEIVGLLTFRRVRG